MRQVGVLAAAGLIALEESPKGLAADHANARYLAERLNRIDRNRCAASADQYRGVRFAEGTFTERSQRGSEDARGINERGKRSIYEGVDAL